MTAQEALTAIINGLENIEEFDEPLGVLKDTIERSVSNDAGDGEDWKSKYTKLSELYKTRFTEATTPTTVTKETETKEQGSITMDDIDFTAKNE